MNNDEQMFLVLLYDGFSTNKIPVDSLEDAKWKVKMEGDHVMDWYVVNARGQRLDK